MGRTKDPVMKQRQASAHARRSFTCPICGKVVRGNGGKWMHRAMHARRAGLPPNSFYSDIMEALDANPTPPLN